MGYVVFEDLDWAEGPAVHHDSCPRYVRRKLEATTVRWHEGYPDYPSATTEARSIARPEHQARLDPPCCRPAAHWAEEQDIAGQ